MRVNLHDVPSVSFSYDDINLIATKLGTPKMLDSFTSTMFIESLGRSSFARTLIECDVELKDCLTIAIPLLDGSGFTKKNHPG